MKLHLVFLTFLAFVLLSISEGDAGTVVVTKVTKVTIPHNSHMVTLSQFEHYWTEAKKRCLAVHGKSFFGHYACKDFLMDSMSVLLRDYNYALTVVFPMCKTEKKCALDCLKRNCAVSGSKVSKRIFDEHSESAILWFLKEKLTKQGLAWSVNVQHNVQHNVNHSVQHNVQHNVQHDVQHKVEHKVEHNVQHHVQHDVMHHVNHNVTHHVNHNVTDHINHNVTHHVKHLVKHDYKHHFHHHVKHHVKHKYEHHTQHHVKHHVRHHVKHQFKHTVKHSVVHHFDDPFLNPKNTITLVQFEHYWTEAKKRCIAVHGPFLANFACDDFLKDSMMVLLEDYNYALTIIYPKCKNDEKCTLDCLVNDCSIPGLKIPKELPNKHSKSAIMWFLQDKIKASHLKWTHVVKITVNKH